MKRLKKWGNSRMRKAHKRGNKKQYLWHVCMRLSRWEIRSS